MNRKVSRILLIAFLVAAFSSFLVYRIVGKQMHSPQQPVTTHIVIASHDLEIGSLIKDVDLSTAEWVGPLPKGAMTKRESVVGRGVVSSLYQGEPIVETRLAASGAGGG